MTTPIIVKDALFYRLFDESERVRWKMSEVPWASIDPASASSGTRKIAQVIAYNELTTFNATEKFLTDFADDADFTQWLSVWLYEETKHPHALMRWLAHVGVSFDEKYVMEGRRSQPFIPNKMATLSMNVISEVMASWLYRSISGIVTDPALRFILRNMAADEARHASQFFSFAKKHIERSPKPNDERRHALKVLFLWTRTGSTVEHPVNLMWNQFLALQSDPEVAALLPLSTLNIDGARQRACNLVGTLIGKPISETAQIKAHLAELTA